MWRKPETWGQDGGEMLLRDARSVCLVAQSCPTLCDPMDCSPLGFSVHGIFQARIPLWVATAFSRVTSWPRDWTCISCTGRQILYPWATWEAPRECTINTKEKFVLLMILLLYKSISNFSYEIHIGRKDTIVGIFLLLWLHWEQLFRP